MQIRQSEKEGCVIASPDPLRTSRWLTGVIRLEAVRFLEYDQQGNSTPTPISHLNRSIHR